MKRCVFNMERLLIVTGTVTYAVKAKDVLVRKGYKAYVERSTAKDRIGCGYGVTVTGDKEEILRHLINAGIKVLSVKYM